MDWWIRVRRVPAVCASLTACLVLGAVADSIQVPVPVMVGGLSFSFPLPFLLPLAPVCLILYGQSRGGSATEVTAARPVGLWDTGFMTVCTAVMLAGGWLVSSMTGHILAVGMARNFLGYLGLALLLRLFTGPHVAAAVVTLFPIACAAFGVHHGTPQGGRGHCMSPRTYRHSSGLLSWEPPGWPLPPSLFPPAACRSEALRVRVRLPVRREHVNEPVGTCSGSPLTMSGTYFHTVFRWGRNTFPPYRAGWSSVGRGPS